MEIWIFIGFYSPPHTKRRLSWMRITMVNMIFTVFFTLLSFLSFFRFFSFCILYSWHFVAHFSVHLVLAIFRPRSKRSDCHRKQEAKAKANAFTLSCSHSRAIWSNSNVVDKKREPRRCQKRKSQMQVQTVEENCNFLSVPSAKWFLYVL